MLAGLPLAIVISSARGAETAPATQSADLAAQEKQECIEHLKTIYKAIQAYEADHKDLPNWLSDLVPKYLDDPNVLLCPVCRRTGKVESPPLADPKIPCSYLFEFCPVPLGNSARNAPNRTRREWKQRQMGLLGSVVPIVRCRHHGVALNLAFDGTIYESPPMWETVFTNRINIARLTAASLFANDSSTTVEPPVETAQPRQFPPRDANAPERLLDLTLFYNATLTESWHSRTTGAIANNLAELPSGLQTFAGVEFDVRGVVQLGSTSRSATNFPAAIKGIAVHQKCRRLHFLHAAAFGNARQEGKEIGSYIIHYASSPMRLEIPIVYGEAVRDWHKLEGEPEPGKDLKVVWTGENELSKSQGRSLRLFLTTWTNLVPDMEIDSIDYVSEMSIAAPFLIAITAD